MEKTYKRVPITLKEYVKQLIMQYPGIFPNALAVYNHLFYVNGNGHEWHNGTLIEPDFSSKSVAECIADMVKHRYNSTQLVLFDCIKDKEIAANLRQNAYMQYVENVEKDIYTILNAAKLAENLSIPTWYWPYSIKSFHFYPISKYSACMNIPDDINHEWKEAIDKLNKIRKDYENQ